MPGSVYAARPITIGRPLWRVDVLQDANAAPNTFDHTHHHPSVVVWEPGSRTFVEELSDDPLPWLADKFTNISSLLKEAGIAPDEISGADADGLHGAAPEIMETVRRMLERVWTGELGQPKDDMDSGTVTSMRASWL
ncbi:hypothetical protein [Streptomyces sp. NPDC017988]|uniref:hypothetical protein n=1 Tax=Streptomyces sp. NPDC017988 TaxID=3365025 RepID=UPI0037BE1089